MPRIVVKPCLALAEVDSIIDAFSRALIPRERWDHRSHLIVCAWSVLADGPLDALPRMRAAIRRFNAANGIVDTPLRGYHETVTAFWVQSVVALYSARAAGDTPLEFVNRVLSRLGDGELIFDHYSRQLLSSPQARRDFVPPDLQPLTPPSDASGWRTGPRSPD